MGTTNIVLCGLGGQGILFMTRVLAEAALDRGLNLMCAETHGMAQRGGSVVSHLRIGDVKGSLVQEGTAHLVMALEENEGYRNLPFLAEGAGFYVNADSRRFPREGLVPFFEKKGIRFRSVDAGELAMEIGAPMSLNLALLGFFAAFGDGPLSHEEIRGTVGKITSSRLREINLRLFDAGFERGSAAAEGRGGQYGNE
ncbi:MAG: indolepyruvate oxidoreductase subunit beta [Deltaproteobacteria bacterium]|nr:indolepyruvate oxidoreductase subunit beta [Deltaproteobacteria bacterium]